MLAALADSQGADRVLEYIEWTRERAKDPENHVSALLWLSGLAIIHDA